MLTFHNWHNKISRSNVNIVLLERFVSLITNNWLELSLLRFHPNKCWLLITIINHHYLRERWWQSSHGGPIVRPLPLAGNGVNLSEVFTQFFSNHNQHLPQCLNSLDNQASINSKASYQKISRHFRRKFLVCAQPWVK